MTPGSLELVFDSRNYLSVEPGTRLIARSRDSGRRPVAETAVTRRIELFTGVLVLPLRQTVSVAKQTAEIDALSGGRLRLGVGVGHVEREFQALNQDYRTRAGELRSRLSCCVRCGPETR